MKICLVQIYCLFLLVYYSKRDHSNKNISSANFLLLPFWFVIVKGIIEIKICLVQIYCLFLFGFDSKKMFDAVYKHHAVVFV